jgi:hypothetical protein
MEPEYFVFNRERAGDVGRAASVLSFVYLTHYPNERAL